MAPGKDDKFLPEIWSWFAVGTLWVVLRFAVRIRTVGVGGMQIDDGFAFLCLFCWTVIIAGIHCTYFTHANSDFTASEVYELSENQIKDAEWGSKFYVITLYCYIAMIFGLKAIVIILYQRLAFGAWQEYLLAFTTSLCAIGYVSTTLYFSLMCLPFHRRWQVRPLPENNCTASSTFFIMLSCFNAGTDALLLAIPIPLLWTLRISVHKRVGVFVLLASGIFVMAACIIRVCLTVVPDITVRVIATWGSRELAIALVAVNSASLRPMFRKSFWMSRDAIVIEVNHRRRGAYVFASMHRVRQRLGRHQFHSEKLMSTSEGTCESRPFTKADCSSNQDTFELENQSHQVVAPPPRVMHAGLAQGEGFISSLGSTGHSAIGMQTQDETRTQSTSGGEVELHQHTVDLERGGVPEAALIR